jgi:uncharacterized protein YheU (UPF0270 family)
MREGTEKAERRNREGEKVGRKRRNQKKRGERVLDYSNSHQ